jgi:TPR repeat protein
MTLFNYFTKDIIPNKFKFECPVCWEEKKFVPETFLCFTCLATVCTVCNRAIKISTIKMANNCPVCRSPKVLHYHQLHKLLNDKNYKNKIFQQKIKYDFFIYDKIATLAIDYNNALAMKCFQYSASQNYPPAQAKLGYLLLKRNPKEAIDWLSLAAAWGIPGACFQMGNWFFNRYRYAEAEFWYLKAANKKYIKSYEMLYIIYELLNDRDNKFVWYPKLISNNSLPSCYRKFMIKNRMIKPNMAESLIFSN